MRLIIVPIILILIQANKIKESSNNVNNILMQYENDYKHYFGNFLNFEINDIIRIANNYVNYGVFYVDLE